ncbi:hypothetical protein AX774_g891 [Zancudomyces culisetae]|uniref:Uncharacterized protein n=1 Tax=Zancudomyces culisetae TaxID=1213189 RepID=A0A1R1PFD6_ZANCU|nr:hypothetical protein AX774_g6887 [Zancudomyces culisetae]OMH85553.1 hypothetical protein AX774_g891 [Zancudomyces culisetae]|eukprot:OMH79694.1 hypothetical protein AX774_g6887 [Zancudomyces culisetae]
MGDEIRLLSLSQNQNLDFELHNTHYFDQNDSLRMTSSHSRNGSSAISHNKGSGDSSDNLKNTQTENNYNLVQKERTSYDYSDGIDINGSSSNPTRTSNVASSATNVVSTAPGSNRSSTDKMLLNGEDTSNSENTGNIGQNNKNNRGRISNGSITSNDSGERTAWKTSMVVAMAMDPSIGSNVNTWYFVTSSSRPAVLYRGFDLCRSCTGQQCENQCGIFAISGSADFDPSDYEYQGQFGG